MTALTGTIPAAGALAADVAAALDALGVDRALLEGAHECRSPITGEVLARTPEHTAADVDAVVATAARRLPGVARRARPPCAASSSSAGASCSPSTRSTSPPSCRPRSARSAPRPSARSRR
ncbi:MAG: hypothetical protein PGN11_18490 [Quadrisphaera sp.]